jgi:hypothetical protein
MNVQEKSDCAVVPVNQPNNEGQQPSAEAGEGRAQTEENIVRAAKLVGVLAGERPVRGTCPVAPVVIPGGGKGDQSVESPGVKVPVGWVKTWSAPTGGRANRQVVARANRGQAPKISPPRESEGGGRRKCRDRERWSKASVVGKGTGCMQPTNFPWSQRATCR